MFRKISRVIIVALLLFSVGVAVAGVDKDDLKENGTGIIKNYTDMNEADPLDWAWVKPGVNLSHYRYKMGTYQNLAMIVDPDMDKALKTVLPKELKRAGSRDAHAPLLTYQVAVYWSERANASKGWIPFAGASLAQAGVGVEMIFTDASGHVVCKIRHAAREGGQLKKAAMEIADDVAEFVHQGGPENDDDDDD